MHLDIFASLRVNSTKIGSINVVIKELKSVLFYELLLNIQSNELANPTQHITMRIRKNMFDSAVMVGLATRYSVINVLIV